MSDQVYGPGGQIQNFPGWREAFMKGLEITIANLQSRVTLEEIDRLRLLSNAALEAYREAKAKLDHYQDADAAYQMLMAHKGLEEARDLVETALRQWWKQDCKSN